MAALAGAAPAILPPPGLEDFCVSKGFGAELGGDASTFGAGLDSKGRIPGGEWANAVFSVCPHLSPEGIRRALCIVDTAIQNAQQAKDLDQIVSGAELNGDLGSTYHCAAVQMRMQVVEQQQRLLSELHMLPFTFGVGSDAAAVERLQEGGGREALGCFAPDEVAFVEPPEVYMPAAADVSRLHVLPVDALPTRAGRAVSGPPSPAASTGAVEVAAHGKVPARQTQVQTLSTSLQLLSLENPDCLFIVRRINKLGFKAARSLKRYFTAFGPVVRVLVAHSTVRQHGDPQCHARRRPSSLGFVQMAKAEAVLKVLCQGEEHEVEGSLIRVQKFERQQMTAEEEDVAEDDSRGPWDRLMSSGSDASTATATTSVASGHWLRGQDSGGDSDSQ